MAPNHEQEDHPEQPPAPSRNGNTTDSIHPGDGESAHEPITNHPQPARASLPPPDDDDTASVASIPSDEGATTTSTGGVVSPSASIPPYWSSARAAEQHLQAHPHSTTPNHHHHARGVSSASAESVLPPGAITLQDNEEEADDEGADGSNNSNTNTNGSGNGRNGNGEHAGRRSNSSELSGRERNRACWARSVQVTDHVLVNGGAMSVGAFVVWNIRVEALNGSRMNIRKRYSEFDDLRGRLVQTFPGFEAAVPALPPKSLLKRFHPRFLEKRRAGLQYFLNCILLNPEFSGSPVLKEFLFS